MTLLVQILLVAAFVLFLLDAFWRPSPAPPRINLTAAGLACATLAFLITNWPR